MSATQEFLSQFSEEELAALEGLYTTGKRLWDTGGGGTRVRVLLGCYNGTRFPFDLTDLLDQISRLMGDGEMGGRTEVKGKR